MKHDLKLTFSLSELTTLLAESSDASRAEIIETLRRAGDDCEAIRPDDFSGADAATQLVVGKLHRKAASIRQRKEARKAKSAGIDPLIGAANPPKGFKIAVNFSDVSDILFIYRRRGALRKFVPTLRRLALRTGNETLMTIGDSIVQLVDFVDQIYPEILYLKARPHIPRIITIHLPRPVRPRMPRRRNPFRRYRPKFPRTSPDTS